MDEATAYKWAAQATRNCNGEPHRRQQCMDNIASALTEAIAALEARVKELEGELCSIDELLARRPALADFDTRVDKINHTIKIASQKDALEARVKELEEQITTGLMDCDPILAARALHAQGFVVVPQWQWYDLVKLGAAKGEGDGTERSKEI